MIGREFTPSLAAGVISAAIRDEGGAEITDIVDVTATIDLATRQFRYSATVRTIYGVMQLTGTSGLNPHPAVRLLHQRPNLPRQFAAHYRLRYFLRVRVVCRYVQFPD